MQKVIRRTVMAEKQAARRKHKRGEANARARRWNLIQQNKHENREKLAMIRQERIARREDWEMGPLAPKRDVGPNKDRYGTVPATQLHGLQLRVHEKHEMLRQLKERYQTIVVGDRVVLLEGRDKGKIGKVSSKDMARGEIKVKDLNMVDVAVPEWMQPEGQEPQPTTSMIKPIPILSVRLVHPIKDPTTGQKKDMIITKLVRSKHAFYDRVTNTAHWHRVIPGLNIAIPWPQKHHSEFKEFSIDTLRMEVEARTYIPTLLTPPMPNTVIDELRNKFSIFRTRHDPKYIEQKMREDREVEAKKQLAKTMRTPMHEINRKERKLRRLRGKGTLTEGMMERIGKAIAEKRRLLEDSVGIGKPEAVPQ